MSSLLLPLQDLGAYVDSREPYVESDTKVTASGKRLTSTYWSTPLTKYAVKQESVRSDTRLDYQRWLSWFTKHLGTVDSFLLDDPEDDTVTDHGFAVGNGVATAFQLQRTTMGSYYDQSGNLYNQSSKPYTNLLFNSSFEADSNADGLADSWSVYNNSNATEPQQTYIVPGLNGGKAQRISWGTAATNTKGFFQAVSAVAGQWYTISLYARASGTNIGKFIGLGWTTAPSTLIVVNCPALSASWQRYVFQVFWNAGVAPSSSWFLTINNLPGGDQTHANTGTFGTLDFDLTQVTTGQFGLNDLQPVETPAAAIGSDLPVYWPNGYSDGFAPVYGLNGDTTIFQDNDWPGKRQLFPYARTNLIGNSAAIDQWTKSSAFVTANVATAPDGTATADQVAEGNPTAAPVLNNLTTNATGGSLVANTYFFKVSALNANGEESLPSGELSTTTTGTTDSVTVAWSTATGATNYRVWVGTATGAENTFFLSGNVTSFTVTSPTGTAGTPLTTTATQHRVNCIGVPADIPGELRCWSVWVKANTLPNINLSSPGSFSTGINFNLGTGAIDGSTALASGVQTSPLWPGWFRVWYVRRGSTSGTALFISGCADNTYLSAGYTGTGRSFFAWGAQCERVSDLNGPTPYIPAPTGAAVTVTDYTLSTSGLVTLAAALPGTSAAFPTGALLSWSGKYYIRVRLDQPSLPLARIVKSMWSTGLKLIQVRT